MLDAATHSPVVAVHEIRSEQDSQQDAEHADEEHESSVTNRQPSLNVARVGDAQSEIDHLKADTEAATQLSPRPAGHRLEELAWLGHRVAAQA